MSRKSTGDSQHISGQANKPLSLPAHSLTHQEVVKEIGANSDDGLTASDAQARLTEYGPNELGNAKSVSPAKILIKQVANAMTLVSVSPHRQLELAELTTIRSLS